MNSEKQQRETWFFGYLVAISVSSTCRCYYYEDGEQTFGNSAELN